MGRDWLREAGERIGRGGRSLTASKAPRTKSRTRGVSRIIRPALAAIAGLLLLDGAIAATLAIRLQQTALDARTLVRTRDYAALEGPLAHLAADARALHLALVPAWVLTPIPGMGPRLASLLYLEDALARGAAGASRLWPSAEPFVGAFTHGNQRTATGKALLARIAPDVRPALVAIKAALPDFTAFGHDFARVNPRLLPAAVRHLLPRPSRARIDVATAVTTLTEVARAAPAVPALLGLGRPAPYLLLMQNSGEIRATGGFLTAYGYLTMKDGVPGHLSAYNIYQLDPEFRPDPARYQPPEPIELRLYLPWPALHLRDSNVSPDVPTFAHTFYRFYYSIPHTRPVDGIVLLDTWFADRLLKALGPTTVVADGHRVVLTAQNANVTMEYLAERSGLPQATRKAFLATAMTTLWHHALAARGPALRRVLGAVLYGLDHEHVLFYLNDPAAERALIAAGWAGAMDRHVSGDYLEVVDENLNGHKDNFALVESVATRLFRRDGRLWETTRVKWVEPAVHNGWMYVAYRAWIRLYVPPGAVERGLRGDHGYHFVSHNPTLHKTVLNAHIFMHARQSLSVPPSTHTLTVTYEFPKGYLPATITLQKQPGARSPHVTVSAGSWSRTVVLTRSATLTLPPGY